MTSSKWKKIEDIDSLADTTKDTYHSYMNSLYQYSGIKDEIEFLKIPDKKLQEILEGFLDHLKKRVKNDEISPNTVPKLFKAYKVLLDANYREHAVSWKPIALQYPKKEKRSGYKPWTTEQIDTFLQYTNTAREKAAIHFQASTGCRVGVHNDPLLIKHMVKMEIPGYDYHCYAILIYAEADETVEEKDQRITSGEIDENDYSFFVFLTPEASQALDEYHEFRRTKKMETLTSDSPIFASFNSHGLKDKGRYYQMSGNAFRHMMEDVLARTSITRIKKRNRYDTMLDHGFRKRFNTIFKLDDNSNGNLVEKLMQHKKGLDGAYLTPTREECFVEFKKAIYQLTINPKERQRQIIKDKENEINELNQERNENEQLRAMLEQEQKARIASEQETKQTLAKLREEILENYSKK